MLILGRLVSTGSQKSGISGPNGNPSALALTVLSDTSIQCDWTNGATNQEGTYAFYKLHSDTLWSSVTALGALTTKNITGLTANSNYDVKVAHFKGSKLSEYSSIVSAFTYIPETKALLARFDSEPANSEKVIINQFIKDLIDAGVWTKADVLYSLDADTENNSKLNYKSSSFGLVKGTTPTFTVNKGWQGDNTGVLATGFNPSSSGENFTAASFSMGGFYYNMDQVAESSLAAREGSTKQLYAIERQSNDGIRVYHTATNTTSSNGLSAMTVGLIMIDVQGTVLKIYVNGVLKQTVNSITIAAFPNYPLFLFGINNSGVILGPTTRMASNIFIGSGMSEAQHLAYFNACIKKFYSKSGNKFNDNLFLNTFDKTSKKLHKVAVCGDSIMANPTGGSIAVANDEGDGYRPFRLTYNTVSRRIYDGMSWNKATHKRLDLADWTKSGTWTDICGTTVIEPDYTNEKYYECAEANGYVEIVVPDGKENFAFICAKDASFDTISITLNGGSIAAYGAASIDCARVRLHANDIGNHYFVSSYEGLPAGANTIRITKGNNTNKVRIWGGLYWSGNTLIVHNVAHGGHAMQDLINEHLAAEISDNAYDHVMFQIPVMNEVSNTYSIATSMVYLNTILTTYLNTTDALIVDSHPFGASPVAPYTNYYTTYNNPYMEDYTIFFKLKAWEGSYSFVNMFNIFKQNIIALGGTLLGGEIGTTYTTDGQHLSESGNTLWYNSIKSIFEKINL